MAELIPLAALTSAGVTQTLSRVLDSFKRDKNLKKDYEHHVDILKHKVGLIDSYRDAMVLGNKMASDWYIQLKNLVYAAVEALEVYDRTVDENKSSNWMVKAKDILYTVSIHWVDVGSERGLAHTIELINKKIDDVLTVGKVRGYEELIKSEQERCRKLRPIQTEIPPDNYPILGRDTIEADLIGKLLAETNMGSSGELQVLGIVGLGGIGKTTLARSIYNNSTVMENFGCADKKKEKSGCLCWVPISSSKFDPEAILREILSVLNKSDSPPAGNLSALTKSLAKYIEGNKFLLVLDDVWSKDENRWEELLTPLKRGKAGSRLIITTRDEDVVKTIDSYHRGWVKSEKLDGLKDEHIWEILKNHAFGTGATDVPKELAEIGNDIAKKLKGLPLAAKAIGRVLGNVLPDGNRKGHWEAIRDSRVWKTMERQRRKDEILIPALALSFLYLPSEAKPCFTYCSLFLKGREIDVRKLVYQWLAHDYVLDKDGNTASDDDGKTAEDMGEGIIDDLQSMSLVTRTRDFIKVGDYKEPVIKMHDLIHDMSMYSGRDDHLQVLDAGVLEKLPKRTVRHLHVDIDEYASEEQPKKVGNYKMLRTLIFNCRNGIGASILTSWFQELQCLRVLELQNLGGELPEDIGKLKHLRYLDLSGNTVEKLPDALANLRHLQVLILSRLTDKRAGGYLWFRRSKKSAGGSWSDLRFTGTLEMLGGLSELRYLDLSGTIDMNALPESITKLSNLRVLLLSSCKDLERLPDEIHNLKRLERLDLCWCFAIKIIPESITALSNLRVLLLSGCHQLTKLPDAIGNLKRLECLNLFGCFRINDLPKSFGTLSHLRELGLSDKSQYPIGLSLTIRGIGKLTSLETLGENYITYSHDAKEIDQLANLNKIRNRLEIYNLDALKSDDVAQKANLKQKINIPGLQLTWNPAGGQDRERSGNEEKIIERLMPHKDIGNLTIRNYTGQGLPSWLTSQYLCSLKYLKLEGLPRLCVVDGPPAVSSEMNNELFPSLETLKFSNLPCLSDWVEADNRDRRYLPRLRHLTIHSCPKLQNFPEIPLTLEEMELQEVGWSRLPSLRCQAVGREGANQHSETTASSSSSQPPQSPSLRTIKISNCPSLLSLSNGILESCNSLEFIEFINCPKLTKLSTESEVSLPPCLREINIIDCPSLETESLQKSFQTLTSLDNLTLKIGCSHLSNSFLEYALDKLLATIKSPTVDYIRTVKIAFHGQKLYMGKMEARLEFDLENKDFFRMVISLIPEGTATETDVFLEWDYDKNICAELLIHILTKLSEGPSRMTNLIFRNVGPWILVNDNFRRFFYVLINSVNSEEQVRMIERELDTISVRGCKFIESLRECNLSSDPWPHVRKLTISHCANLETPPRRGFATLTALVSLTLESCPKLTRLSCEDHSALPTSLQELFVRHCGSLAIDSVDKSLKAEFTCLKKVVLQKSPRCVSIEFVKQLLQLLPKLDLCELQFHNPRLKISYRERFTSEMGFYAKVGKAEGNEREMEEDTNCTQREILSEMLRNISHLGIIGLSSVGVHGLEVMDAEGDNFSPPHEGRSDVEERASVQHLIISNFNQLCSLPYFCFLKSLVIRHCNGIQDLSCLNNAMPRLCYLSISDCEKLEHPPENGFVMLISLGTLILKNCPKLSLKGLEDFGLSSSLRKLAIVNCGSLRFDVYAKVDKCVVEHLFSNETCLTIAWKEQNREEDDGDSSICLEFLVKVIYSMSSFNITNVCIIGNQERRVIAGRLNEVLVALTSLRDVNCENLCSDLHSYIESSSSIRNSSLEASKTLDETWWAQDHREVELDEPRWAQDHSEVELDEEVQWYMLPRRVRKYATRQALLDEPRWAQDDWEVELLHALGCVWLRRVQNFFARQVE